MEVLAQRGALKPTAPYGTVLEEYLARCDQDTDAGYTWALTCMAGLMETAVLDAAVLAWVAHRHLVPPSIRGLLSWLENQGIEVWIVSASNRWAIEVAAAELGVDSDRIIAMNMDVVDGALTGEVHRPLVNGAGKAESIRKRIGVSPLLAVGNSVHDAAMLELAQVGVTVRLPGEDGGLPEPSTELQALATMHGWYQRSLTGA